MIFFSLKLKKVLLAKCFKQQIHGKKVRVDKISKAAVPTFFDKTSFHELYKMWNVPNEEKIVHKSAERLRQQSYDS